VLCDLLAGLSREPAVHRLSLSGLDRAAVAALVGVVIGEELDDAAAGLPRALYDVTDGNAFLLTHLLRDLLGSPSERCAPTVEAFAALGIPPAVAEAISACRAGLSEFADRALGLAAVVGEEFDLTVLEEAAGLDEGQLLDALDEAARAGLAFEVPGRVGRYRFAHALTRHAVLAALGGTRRARLEERVRRRSARQAAAFGNGRTGPAAGH
jgi:predicted ATPase